MRLLSHALILTVIVAARASAAPDEIDKAIDEGVPKNGLWMNGTTQLINLPADASPAEVVAQIVEIEGRYIPDQFTNYRIVSTKKVNEPSFGLMTAVLITSSKGSRTLILMQSTDDQLHHNTDLKIQFPTPTGGTLPPKFSGWRHRSFYLTTAP